MNKYRIGICGYFDTQSTIPNGQTIKTKEVTKALKLKYGKDIYTIDYSQCRKHPFSFFLKYFIFLFRCKYVILFPDANAYKVFIPIALLFKYLFHTKIMYDVIGAWLPDALKRSIFMTYCIRNIDVLFIETSFMKIQLSYLNITNVLLVNNFKDNVMPPFNEKLMNNQPPFKLCFCSRIEPQKGVLEMIEVINRLNSTGKTLFTLDIYGGIENEFRSSFKLMSEKFPIYINYKGEIKSEDVCKVVSKYFLQLFPTKYSTEGIPGSIIDSFFAGVPVVASKWNSAEEVVVDNFNGFLFDFNNYDMMYEKLSYLYKNPEEVFNIRKNCIESSKKFIPENAIIPIISFIK